MTVAHALSKALEGIHEVFIDTKIPLGATWGNVIEESLGQADWMIALVSAKSATSAMVVTEIETAHRLNVERGRPILIPIRLGDIGALHYPLSAYMSRFQQAEWRTDADTPMLVTRVVEALNAPPQRRSVASQRQALITRVRSDWITGVLAHSLQHVVRLELGLALDRSRVVSGMDALIQRPHQEAQPLRSGTTALDVLDDHHGQLLILGGPGVGQDDNAFGAGARSPRSSRAGSTTADSSRVQPVDLGDGARASRRVDDPRATAPERRTEKAGARVGDTRTDLPVVGWT